jgi:hypothetical protein
MKHTIRTRNFTDTIKVVEVDDYTRGLAIKVFCTECLGYEDNPKTCTAPLCPLFPYRAKSEKAYTEGVELSPRPEWAKKRV